MGTWGPALYSDDLAADVRSDLYEMIGTGATAVEAIDRLSADYADSLQTPDEKGVFWIAVADTAWRLGRPVERATTEALRVIASGSDLLRWENKPERRKREAALQKVAKRLQSTAPPPKRVRKPHVAANEWAPGEVIAFRLSSGSWVSFRVVDHHVDKGGRSAICEPLDWTGVKPPIDLDLEHVEVRSPVDEWTPPAFMLIEPRRKAAKERFLRTGLASLKKTPLGSFLVVATAEMDQFLGDRFGLS